MVGRYGFINKPWTTEGHAQNILILTILHDLHDIGIQLMQSNIFNRRLSLSGSGISRFLALPDLFLELLSYLFAFWKLLGILRFSCSHHIARVK